MAVNKVMYGNQTLIDLSTDTVASSDDILAGKVGHLRDGTVVTGTASGGDQHGTIWQDGQGYVHLDDESGIALQSKTATPTESQQVIEADTGYYALDKVTVGAISSSYVGSGVSRRSSSDLTVSGATVTAPAGYYSSSASKAVATGTAGTPTATKGSVSNHAVTVTPSVTNTTGYISGGTKTGTAVTVTASELVSGTKSITENGTGIDVTNYASVNVNVSGGGAKLGALRSDAELIKTWSGDYLAVSDLGTNIPAYSTSSTSVLSTSQLPDSVALDLSSYRYIICIRRVITPVYATVINTAGRCEYTFRAATFEVVYFPAGCFSENNHNDSYAIPLVNEYFGIVYQTAPSTANLAANTQTSLSSINGVHDGTPLIGNFMTISWSNPTLTITALRPALYMRSSNTYFKQEHWENVSDIRMQYVTEIWRVPKGGVDGFNIQSQTNHILDCVMNERELT